MMRLQVAFTMVMSGHVVLYSDEAAGSIYTEL